MGAFIPSPEARQQLLICQGDAQQLVWSVHLSGWLELGWQVVPLPGEAAPQLGLQQQVPAAVEPLQKREPEPVAVPMAPRPAARRGRRPANREPVLLEPVASEPVAPGPVVPEPVVPEPVAPEPVQPVAGDPLDRATAEQLLDLPDDLFDDPLS